MTYRVSPLNKKSVVEITSWTKGDEVLKYSVVWRWGAVLMEDKPDLSDVDAESEINVYDTWDCELDSCDDGCSEDWTYPTSWTEEDIEAFQEAWGEEFNEAPLNMGFEEDDTELWFLGELEVTEVE